MATHTLKFYDGAPFENGFPVVGAGGDHTYTGPATADGEMIVTDNGSGINGETLARSDTATADATINGLTSIGSGVRAVRGYLVQDTITGETFSFIQMYIEDGDAQGFYTLSEMPLVAGRDYTLLGSSTPPSASSPAAFTYAEYVCFASGTLIQTPQGPQPIEDLRVGSCVITLDHGPQKIVWRGHRALTFGPDNQNHKPILFTKDSLGKGCPNDALVVSPQHRILLKHRTLGANDEFLGLAKSLVARAGIRVMGGKRDVIYHTLMTEQHEVIFANGLGVETFYPGPQGLSLLTPQERFDVLAAVSARSPFGTANYGATARQSLGCAAIQRLGNLTGVAMYDLQAV